MFRDRVDAGRQIVTKLLSDEVTKGEKESAVVVLSIPRGGVVVGREVARALGCEHSVIVTKKIGHPNNSELAVGAVAEDGEPILNSKFEIRNTKINEQIEKARSKVKAYVQKFRGGRGLDLGGKRLVIVVDDGVATGETARASISWLNSKFEARNPKLNVILAVPVGARSSIEELRKLADRVVCLQERDDLMAVGQFYENFEQVSDEEVVEILSGRD